MWYTSKRKEALVERPAPNRALIRLLIVDDSPDIRLSLRALLRIEPDIEVVSEVSNGHEAVSFCLTYDVDVVLMDYNMPQMNGIDAIRLILENRPAIRIIGLTAEEDPIRKAMLDAGAHIVLNKLTDTRNLVAAIRYVNRK